MLTLFINLLGLAGICFIIWWFWLSEPKAVTTDSQTMLDILVKDGTYHPAYIETKAKQKLKLRFLRKDSSPCAEVVLFSKLNLSKTLPLNEPVVVILTVDTPGEYEFTCQMGMYRGKLIVR